MKNEQNTTLTNGPEYWQSLEQYNGNPEFAKRAENEFMSSPYAPEDAKDGFARREFLKLMGASIAMATTACVRRPIQHIIPYAQAPKELTPGIANFYASSWFDGNEGYGLLVKTLDGRPIKLEGNPQHPMNLGSLPARAHAEVLSLYDPDRLKGPTQNSQNKDRTNREAVSARWDLLDPKVVEQLAKGGVAILSSTLPSPSSKAMIADFLRVYPGRWVQYDALPSDAIVEGQRRSYGRAVFPRYRLDQARMVVSIDADLLGTFVSPAEFMKQWGKARKPGADMLRLVMFESTVSLTGLNADDRYRIKPSQQLDVVYALINAVSRASKGAANVPAAVRGGEEAAARIGVPADQLAKIGEQLWANRGKSLVVAGGLPTEQSVDVQVAVNLLNSVLGNDGATIDHDVATYQTRQGSTAELTKLIADMNSGAVKNLIIHGTNPVYTLPTDLGFVEALRKVPFIVYTGNYNDETGVYANYVLPAGSSLESWGDHELQSGVISIQQPTIRPLHDSRSFEESLLAWTQKAASAPARAKGAKDWYEYVRGVWRTEIQGRADLGRGKSFDDFWQAVLQEGVVDTTGGRRASARGNARAFNGAGSLNTKARTATTGYELALFPTSQLADGKYANVAWLQELPDPVTKIVWDNYLMVSPAMARKEGLHEGDKVDLTVGKKKIRVPVHVQPGMHDEVLALAVGYGRTRAGKVAKDIGVNAFELASFVNGNAIFSGQAATIAKTAEKYRLVSTQDHHTMEGRQIVIETTNAAYQKNPEAGIHRHKVFSIWPEHQYNKHRWAMSIDLNVCTGCSACVIACQSENNVPVVGKRYVMDGREMHWLRIDRYYKGTPENPEAVFQPMLCQHCETAPCETVCPVLATVHNDEGLNDMVYNRCVGTRYCSNNCPYKVRRFNWFNYSKREAPLHMALNPDVTVRSRGVMEKCTFCVQRIRHTTNVPGDAKRTGRIPDGTIKTACQQTCPTDAIIFGDLNDKDSAVHKLFEDKRTYAVLEEINTQPRVRYMTRIRNADRVVADAHGGHGNDHGGDHGDGSHKDGHGDGHGAAAPAGGGHGMNQRAQVVEGAKA